MAEPAHTKFNLTYPPQPFNGTGTGFQNSSASGQQPTVSVFNAVAGSLITASFDSDEPEQHYDTSNIPGILAGILIPHIFCTIFVGARVWSRVWLLRKWFLDDTLIVLAWICCSTVCVMYAITTQLPNINEMARRAGVGGGSSWTPESAKESMETLWAAILPYIVRTYIGLVFYQLCLIATKLSILAFYLRMFNSRPIERRLAQATVVLVLLYGAPLLVISVLQCHPGPGLFFNQRMTCFSFQPLLVSSASLHAITDAWLIAMVVPTITRLSDLPPRQRAALAVVLSLSVFVIAASLTRLQLSLKADYRPAAPGVRISNTLAFFVMTMLECDIALMCASAPTLRPVVARLWPRLGMGEQKGGGGGGDRRERRERRRQRMLYWRQGGDNEPSMNLTAVSYHGYPWAERMGSSHGEDKRAMNAPPVPALPVLPTRAATTTTRRTQRTQSTTLSLRSFMSSVAARSRAATMASARRQSIVGIDGQYYEIHDDEEKRHSRIQSNEVVVQGPWRSSQESFVLGMNDPASPNRLSPVSGFSGVTFTAADDDAADETGSHPDEEEQADEKAEQKHGLKE